MKFTETKVVKDEVQQNWNEAILLLALACLRNPKRCRDRLIKLLVGDKQLDGHHVDDEKRFVQPNVSRSNPDSSP